MILRDYQKQAVKSVQQEFRDGKRSTLLVMATGTGKTVVFCDLAKTAWHESAKPVLVLAHRNELLTQAANKLTRVGMTPAIEKADSYALNAGHNAVVASVQSLSIPKRLERYSKDYFSFIIVDEAHHSTSTTYRRILDHFNAVRLGVTATPNRHDEIGLKNIFESCAYQYSIKDGIKDKWLCGVRGVQVQVQDLTLEDVKIVAGDFSQPELDLMLRQESVLQGMVLPTIENAEDRPTIVFTPGVEHAHEIAACFNRVSGKDVAVAVDGSMNDIERAKRLELFESRQRQFIVNVGVLTEGYDYPPTACIALFRPTKSLGLLAQMVGRGTRNADGKDDCVILDFIGMDRTVKTKNIYDVLDGTILNDLEKEKALEFQQDGCDAMDALSKAKAFVAHLDSIKAKMTALSTCSAFDIIRMFEIPSCRGLYGGDLATEKQIAKLTEWGVRCGPDLQKGEAMKLMDTLYRRYKKSKATLKQMKYLKALGYENNFMEDLSFAEASAKIAELKANI